jgi:Bacterial Ig domain
LLLSLLERSQLKHICASITPGTATATVDPNTGARLIIPTTNDRDGDPVTVTASAPSHGTLTALTATEMANLGITGNAAAYRYTPDTAYAHTGGTDTVTFTATDSYGASSQIPVTINVVPINHAPVVAATVGGAQAQTGSRIIIATASDPDSDPVTLAVTGAPSHGSLTLLSDAEKDALGLVRSVTAHRYTPFGAYAHSGGPETIAFGVTDSRGAVGGTAINFVVDPINNAPTADVTVNDPDPTTGAVDGVVAGNDADGDSLTHTVSAGPIRGTVTFNPTTGQFTYTPSDDARAAAVGVGQTFTGTGWVTGSNFNSVNSSYPANQTLSQYVVFDSAMQQGGTFTLSVNAHAGGGNSGNSDTANVKLDFYRADGTVVKSARTIYNRNLSQASGTVSWTTVGLSYALSEADAAQTAYVKVSLIGADGDFWAGNYGPQWAVPTLTFNDGATNILYNPEFGQVAQGWTGNVAACGSQGAAQAWVTNSGVGANAGGDGYDANGGTVNGHAGGYSNTLSAAQLLTTVNNGGTPPAELTDSFEVTVSDGHGGSTTVVVDVPVTPASPAAAAQSA